MDPARITVYRRAILGVVLLGAFAVASGMAGDGQAAGAPAVGAYAWGSNEFGQLGNGTSIDSLDPVPVALSSWSSVSAGGSHSCGIRSDGTLWCWGSNGYGQIGDGTTTDRWDPVQVGAADTWLSISARMGSHSCGIRSDGTLWCWGSNGYGQIGDGTTTDRWDPVQVGAADTWLSVSASGANPQGHTCAVRSDGTLWCWGQNNRYQLGDGTRSNRLVPTQIGTVETWRSVSGGAIHTCALRSDNTLWCWGSNNHGQVGFGTTASPFPQPTQVGNSAIWLSVSAGWGHSCGLQVNETLWCWGLNDVGQLGDGGNSDGFAPKQVGSASWTFISPGESATCGVRSDKTLWCWGRNEYGQLGDGTTVNRGTPTQVGDSAIWLSVSVGFRHTAAVIELPGDMTAPVISMEPFLLGPSPTDPLLMRLLDVEAFDEAAGSGIAGFQYGWVPGIVEAEIAADPASIHELTADRPMYVNFADASPSAEWTLLVRAVDNAGNLSGWSKVIHGVGDVTPPRPLVIVLGDSVSSGHRRIGRALICTDRTFAYGNEIARLLSDAIGLLNAPAWDSGPGYDNFAASGFSTGRVRYGGADACGVRQISPLTRSNDALRANEGSWNYVFLTAGINDTNWTTVLRKLLKQPLTENACRRTINSVWNLDEVAVSISENASFIVNTRLRLADSGVRIGWLGYYNTAVSPIPSVCEVPIDEALANLRDAIMDQLSLGDVQFVSIDSVLHQESSLIQGFELRVGRRQGWPHPNEAGHVEIGELAYCSVVATGQPALEAAC